MKFIKVVAILFSAFHIQTSAYIFSISESSAPTPSPDAILGFNGAILAAIIAAIVALLKDKREPSSVRKSVVEVLRNLNQTIVPKRSSIRDRVTRLLTKWVRKIFMGK